MKTFIYLAAVLTCLIRACSSDRLNAELEHMKTHLVGFLNATGMNINEMRFMYFKTHDLNDDYKLDGCELVKSLYDHLGVESRKMILSDAEIEYYVDMVLSSDDFNDDGFITFPEYSKSQNMRLTTSTGNSILGRS